jgi:hypothetical protein
VTLRHKRLLDPEIARLQTAYPASQKTLHLIIHLRFHRHVCTTVSACFDVDAFIVLLRLEITCGRLPRPTATPTVRLPASHLSSGRKIRWSSEVPQPCSSYAIITLMLSFREPAASRFWRLCIDFSCFEHFSRTTRDGRVCLQC